MKSPITTHILDTQRGRPADGVDVRLERVEASGEARELARGTTDGDGRIGDLLPPGSIEPGTYRLQFGVGAYFERLQIDTFYPEVVLTFRVDRSEEHYHVPLLLSPFGYTTYRGS